uniref:Uncharacterized protein n=1 Tax=Hemiselmis tepida TaxID=464990 RepID=A0A7S0Z185_9CRYP
MDAVGVAAAGRDAGRAGSGEGGSAIRGGLGSWQHHEERWPRAAGAPPKPNGHRRGTLGLEGALDDASPEAPAKTRPLVGMEGRTRVSLNGDVDWCQVDPLELAHADRRADAIEAYTRPELAPADVEDMKQRWQRKQVKRMSKAAQLYGARQSQRDLWDFLELRSARQRTEELAAGLATHAGSECGGREHRAVRAGVRRDKAAAHGSVRLAVAATGDLGDEDGVERDVDDMASAASTAISSASTARSGKGGSVSLKKQFTSVFKNLWGPPQDSQSHLKELAKKIRKNKGQNGLITL